MTLDELMLIEADGAVVRTKPDEFARSFYAALFEIAPQTRELFPDDLTAQRGKLVAELEFLIEAATGSASSGDLSPFVERARELGRRHVGYGVTGRDYAFVGDALLRAVAEHADSWDDDHERAWRKLYRLISDVMREGAAGALFARN